MVGVTERLIEIYQDFTSTLPGYWSDFFNLLILVILIVMYTIFIWKFYRFIARKNILELDLMKYNRAKHPLVSKIFGILLYLVEYIVILPFWIFVWFSVFTLFLIFLSESLDIHSLLIISATVVAAIRVTAYYKEELAKDISKLVPFTLLAISISNPNFFDVERIINHFSSIPSLFSKIVIYLVFIIILEMLLRFLDFIFSFFDLITEEEQVDEDEED